MSFFKKLTEEFKELKASFDDSGKEKKDGDVKPEKTAEVKPEKAAEGTREGGSGPPPYGSDPSYAQNQQYGAPPSQYGQAPYGQQYSSPPFQQQPYGQPPSGQYDRAAPPPPSSGAPPGQPQLPPGWISQWDHNSQRYYYVEQATGRTQWDAPQNYNYSSPPPPPQSGYAPPPSGPGGYHDQSRDQRAASDFHNQYGGAMPAPGYNNPQHQDNSQQYYCDIAKAENKAEKKKDNSTRNMLLAGAGGLAVGGLAVAALDDSDDEYKAAPVAAPAAAPGAGYGAPAAGYGGDSSYGGYPPAAPLPAGDESDRESLVEAQQEYNEAAAAAADSDASSSELEDLQEAREDYEEAAEDYYED